MMHAHLYLAQLMGEGQVVQGGWDDSILRNGIGAVAIIAAFLLFGYWICGRKR